MKRWQVVEWLTLMWPVFFFGSTPDIKNTFTAQLLDYNNNKKKNTKDTRINQKKKKPYYLPYFIYKIYIKNQQVEGREKIYEVSGVGGGWVKMRCIDAV